jgi:hypothetical protein
MEVSTAIAAIRKTREMEYSLFFLLTLITRKGLELLLRIGLSLAGRHHVRIYKWGRNEKRIWEDLAQSRGWQGGAWTSLYRWGEGEGRLGIGVGRAVQARFIRAE